MLRLTLLLLALLFAGCVLPGASDIYGEGDDDDSAVADDDDATGDDDDSAGDDDDSAGAR